MPLPGTVTCSYTLLKIKNCKGIGTGTAGTFLLVPETVVMYRYDVFFVILFRTGCCGSYGSPPVTAEKPVRSLPG